MRILFSGRASCRLGDDPDWSSETQGITASMSGISLLQLADHLNIKAGNSEHGHREIRHTKYQSILLTFTEFKEDCCHAHSVPDHIFQGLQTKRWIWKISVCGEWESVFLKLNVVDLDISRLYLVCRWASQQWRPSLVWWVSPVVRYYQSHGSEDQESKHKNKANYVMYNIK